MNRSHHTTPEAAKKQGARYDDGHWIIFSYGEFGFYTYERTSTITIDHLTGEYPGYFVNTASFCATSLRFPTLTIIMPNCIPLLQQVAGCLLTSALFRIGANATS